MINYSGSNRIVVASHRRSGTHLTIDSIRQNFSVVNNQFITLERILPSYPPCMTLEEFKSYLENTDERVIIKTHLAPFELENIVDSNLRDFIKFIFDTSKIVYVIRDGRDVLNSLFYYVKSYNEKQKNTKISDFLKQKIGNENKINRIEYWKLHVESWLSQKNDRFILQYESFEKDFKNVISELEVYFEMKKNQKIYKPELRKKGSSAVFPRKGVVGDYQHIFSEEDLDLFSKIAGTLLKDLGYE